MYIHLGNEISISDKGIIGIFDIENTSLGNDTRQFLKRATDDDSVVNVSFEMPKSFIVCNEKNAETVYISQISADTLLKRAKTSI
ncbi:MAG: DUF370 domain-containing protein [Ruminococcus sp.]|jgi:hypothetical protein|nr:DUF370 domain-containing protein [Ruminococcus sp.]